MCRHRCPLGRHSNLLQSNAQPCQQRSATFLASCCPLPRPRYTTQASFVGTNSNFWPFYRLFPGSFQVLVEFHKNRSRKCSRMHNSICGAYANRRNLARRDERFCGDNFPVKEARTEPAAASGKYDGTSVCVARQPEELCTLSPLSCSRHPNL